MANPNAPKFSRLPGVDVHTTRGMDHMRAWNKTGTRQLDVVADGGTPASSSSFEFLEGCKQKSLKSHSQVNIRAIASAADERAAATAAVEGATAGPKGVFDMTPPYGALGVKLPADAPHKAHHHYFGWSNTMDNKSEPDGSRDAFNTYGYAQSYCDKIHNKAASINSKAA
uniref:Uncharacterized protein n=1 Tax=Mantoniella antarctica TaxID=81844 RepID=A0A7S0X6I2_9CHLO|mmetsp:Transcript_21386/g.52838  ORF Transcript_21386/g.52838 Transcript_21386/m.52838 type:complete len:170 (+) Transcript_21386:106-615(+)